ncbi:MAG: hypothetical protein LKJ76_02455 [Lachnospiraceae bacterium]|jgi:alpha-L-rhamnosidase|nr:hypothetical protein [Lachnospiraceae bacterium]
MSGVDWITIPRSEIERCGILDGDMTGRFACFVKCFEAEAGTGLTVKISANSRYRLFVNGISACTGPAKGNLNRWYYETADLSRLLKNGTNVLAVQVLYQERHDTDMQSERAPIFGVISPAVGHRLFVEGEAVAPSGKRTDLSTGAADWKCRLESGYYLVSAESTSLLGAIIERFHVDDVIRSEYKTDPAVSRDWVTAAVTEPVIPDRTMSSYGLLQTFPLRERDIPLLSEQEESFARELTGTSCLRTGSIYALPGEKTEVILDIGFVKNTYPEFQIPAGHGTIRFTWFEKFTREGEELERDDCAHGEIGGYSDLVTMGDHAYTFEPFWVRTFRFLRITIASEEAMQLPLPEIRRVVYPLEIVSDVTSSEAWVGKIYQMGVRTLQGCMLETYMDCPFYEQLQYPMDTRLQMLFTYCLSGDHRLAAKALEDMHDSIFPNGLVPGRTPACVPQIISTFSLYYIFALWEYYENTGELAILRKYRGDPDRILDYYDSRIGSDGLVGWPGFWPFVDWQKEWADRFGVPTGRQDGPSSIINLMYGYALLTAAKIADTVGRPFLAEEYRTRQKAIAGKVREYFRDDGEGLYRDRQDAAAFSEHAQSWAVLNGLETGSSAAALMRRAAEKKGIIPVSFSTSYEFFRANETAGTYELTKKQMDKWIRLIDLHCGTCPEEPLHARSDCHAWSALPVYEFLRGMTGIRPLDPEWKRIRVTPHLDYVKDLSGHLYSPKGIISFRFVKTADGSVKKELSLPQGMALDEEQTCRTET